VDQTLPLNIETWPKVPRFEFGCRCRVFTADLAALADDCRRA
jgi:hypothetical protein